MIAFLARPIKGDWSYVCLDATYVKVRRDHHIVSVAVIIAVGVNTDARRVVLGMTVGNSEAEAFWIDFLAPLRAPRPARHPAGDLGRVRGPEGGHREAAERGLAEVPRALTVRSPASLREQIGRLATDHKKALAHAGKTQRRIVSAWIGTAFAQDDATSARKQ